MGWGVLYLAWRWSYKQDRKQAFSLHGRKQHSITDIFVKYSGPSPCRYAYLRHVVDVVFAQYDGIMISYYYWWHSVINVVQWVIFVVWRWWWRGVAREEEGRVTLVALGRPVVVELVVRLGQSDLGRRADERELDAVDVADECCDRVDENDDRQHRVQQHLRHEFMSNRRFSVWPLRRRSPRLELTFSLFNLLSTTPETLWKF